MKYNDLINESRDEDVDINKAPAAGETGKYITTAQAARILGVGMSRIRQLIMDGELKSHKPAKGRRDNFLLSSDIYRLKKKMKDDNKEKSGDE